jgi:tetratricopeptide (TPR) repeat protein
VALPGGVVSGASFATDSPHADRPDLVALDYAFRFATAIQNDPKDRAKAQELALAGYLAAGAYDEAGRAAAVIEGWRRGVVYADLASALARDGRTSEARSWVDKAEEVRTTVDGWQNPRISAHVAEALAAIGDPDKAFDIASALAAQDPVQYAGRAGATEALALGLDGDLDAAMKKLQELEGNNDLDVAWWRTSGYLALARREQSPASSRLAALDAARASAAVLPVERRVEAWLETASLYDAVGRAREGRSAVKAALGAVEAEGVGTSERIPYVIEIGRAWGALREPKRARQALVQAEGLVPQAISIDRPGLLARIASGYRRIPDAPRARRLDEQAIEAAAQMPLSRPRALALSAICRQMGRDQVVPDPALRARLDHLLAGLGDPW